MDKMFQVVREEILDDIDDLHKELAGFKQALLNDAHLKPLSLYSIQLRKAQSVGETILVKDASTSDEYRDLIASAMTEIYMMPGQSPQESIRLPGAIVCSQDTFEAAKAINLLKLELVEKIDTVEPRQRRNIYRLRGSLHALQMRRIFELGPSQPRSISLFWHASPSSSRIRVQELTDQLLNNLKSLCDDNNLTLSTLPDFHQGEVENGIIKALETLIQYDPTEVVAKVKARQPHVRARISYLDNEGKTSEFQAPCSLPVLFSSSAPAPKVMGSLGDFRVSDMKPSKDNSRIERDPLVESINVFRYKKPYRKFLDSPVEAKSVKRKTAAAEE